MNETDIKTRIETFLNEFQLDQNQKNAMSLGLTNLTQELVSHEGLRNRLQILFEYEKHCLETIKAYKDEIKFVASLQEDLRRERSQFFTQTHKEVSTTLKQAQVSDETAQAWINELVASYTTSLDLSSDLAKTNATEMKDRIKTEQQQEVQTINFGNQPQN